MEPDGILISLCQKIQMKFSTLSNPLMNIFDSLHTRSNIFFFSPRERDVTYFLLILFLRDRHDIFSSIPLYEIPLCYPLLSVLDLLHARSNTFSGEKKRPITCFNFTIQPHNLRVRHAKLIVRGGVKKLRGDNTKITQTRMCHTSYVLQHIFHCDSLNVM